MRLRISRPTVLAVVAILVIVTFLYFPKPHGSTSGDGRTAPRPIERPISIDDAIDLTPSETVVAAGASSPLPFDNPRVHPIDQLIRDAEASWLNTQQSQSKTLAEAVKNYQKRYGIPPPPNFDKWFAFAKKRNVAIIDDYDTIHEDLLPFWGLQPATIRSRAREAQGFNDNNLLTIMIRNGEIALLQRGREWLQEALQGMMKDFVQYLPDMDLSFNIHDEPRVVVPYERLKRLKDIGREAMARSAADRNKWSARPKDMSGARRIFEAKTSRFNVFAHQQVWIPSKFSCPETSPAQILDDSNAVDNITAYALGELGFVYNRTAFTDICNSPSFATSHGFFDRPNAFNVAHDLVPVFSQSKMSSFQDILFPSPWYWYGKVAYDKEQDLLWDDKVPSLWWRGSTTGGFSRAGGWRRQHRQQLVRKLNAPDQALIMKNMGGSQPDWRVKKVSREAFSEAIDVHFSHVGQCDDGDCDAQRAFFDIAPEAAQSDAWKYRFLLDMDGNAFSGRFYAFLKSRSLTFKMAVFREWHEEWIKPWVHYIPLSLRGDDVLESVRYFQSEEEGKSSATRIAQASTQWAEKALRNEDLEAWFFRLLLEYGRVVDDARESIGYA